MNPTLYLETTVIGHLTSWPSSLLQTAAIQQATREWWDDHRHNYDLFVSRFVVDECAAGDSTAAADRLEQIKGIPLLDVTDDVTDLADALLIHVPLPQKAQVDALHVALAGVHGVQYLLTWNCKHIANAVLRPNIERVCRDCGLEPPVICTPHELMENPR
jgi:hypothetical protein